MRRSIRFLWRLAPLLSVPPATGTIIAFDAEPPIEGSPPRSSRLKLVQVQIIFRHGARTPISPVYGYDGQFPTEPGCEFVCRGSSTPLFFSDARRLYHRQYSSKYTSRAPKSLTGYCRPGQLTVQGRKDLRTVGEALRELYIEKLQFLQPEFSPQEVLVRSTDVERTLESAVSLLEALYPAMRLAPGIFITTLKEADENMYPRSSCRALRALKSAALKASLQQRAVLRDRLTNKIRDTMKIGKDPGPIVRFEGLHNTYQCYLANQMALPYAVPAAILREIEEMAVSEMQAKWGSIPAIRLGIGRFIGDLLHDLQRSASSKVRLRLYSGHDNTVGPLLIALESDPTSKSVGKLERFPYFASYIALELYSEEGTDRQWVRGRYSGNREDLALPTARVNQDGLMLAELSAFSEQMRALVPDATRYEDECDTVPGE